MNAYPVPKDYTWDLKIASFDVGQDRQLKLSAQLRLQQEAGELQLEKGGLGFEELINNGLAFVITRTNSVIYHTPRFNSHIKLITWHRDSKGAQFYRCYRFLDENGEILIDSVSAFALIDPQTHKILRPALFSRYAVTQQPDRLNSCPDPEKQVLPDGLLPIGGYEVVWSDIDYNGHVNNAIYADIICNNIPDNMRQRRIAGFTISYLHEAFEGEIISLKSGVFRRGNQDEVWVSGETERGSCFEGMVKYNAE
ncbi:MAG: thioesterase [Oscillospiraceae bacterium]|nr:thioesterase [Oscillospiraceae bacterium]MDD4414783.1 thioesterase [Oscillospiraceae bacterium]